MQFMIVKDYVPVEQISRKDIDVVRHAGEDFGIVLTDEQAMELLTESLYHRIRLYGASDTEVRDEIYTRFIINVMGSFSDENHTLHYEDYSSRITKKALEKGYKTT